MKIAIGTDHRGFVYKEYIKKYYAQHEWIDVGAHSEERTDYPLYAMQVVHLMCTKNVACAVLLCGTGSGMAIAVNRHSLLYAAVAWNSDVARRVKEEDNCNVLVIPADCVSQQEVLLIIDAWLQAEFKGGRYAQRLAMIDTVR
jgi:ribose 5-phosphate isomerase B